jgi:hypothetical protein
VRFQVRVVAVYIPAYTEALEHYTAYVLLFALNKGSTLFGMKQILNSVCHLFYADADKEQQRASASKNCHPFEMIGRKAPPAGYFSTGGRHLWKHRTPSKYEDT